MTSLNERLVKAAEEGKVDEIEALLDQGADIDCTPPPYQVTPLIKAIHYEKEAAALYLVNRGANLSLTDIGGDTLLHLACNEGLEAVVRELLRRGADIGAEGWRKRQPLHRAAQGGHEDIARLLVTEHGAQIDAKDGYGLTPLLLALRLGREGVAAFLLSAGADASISSTNGWTALHCACYGGLNRAVIRLLDDFGLDLHAKAKQGFSCLHFAASRGHVEICRLLLERGLPVDDLDDRGDSPLVIACMSNTFPVIELLLDHGANMECKNKHGWATLGKGMEIVLENDFLKTLFTEPDTPTPPYRRTLRWALTSPAVAALVQKNGWSLIGTAKTDDEVEEMIKTRLGPLEDDAWKRRMHLVVDRALDWGYTKKAKAPEPTKAKIEPPAALDLGLTIDLGSSSLRVTLIDRSKGYVMSQCKRTVELDPLGGLVLRQVEEQLDEAVQEALDSAPAVAAAAAAAAAPGSATTSRLNVVFATLVSAVVAYREKENGGDGDDTSTVSPFSHVLTYANKGLFGSAALPPAAKYQAASSLSLCTASAGIPAVHPAYAMLPLLELSEATKGAKLSFASLTSHLIARWTRDGSSSKGDTTMMTMSPSEAAWAGLLDLRTGTWDPQAASLLAARGIRLPTLQSAAASRRFTSSALLSGSRGSKLFSRFSEVTFAGALGDGAAASLASLSLASFKSATALPGAPFLPSSLGKEDGSSCSVQLCLTVGTSSALRGVFPVDAVLSALCFCAAADAHADGHAKLSASARPSLNSKCISCGKQSLAQLGLWCYRFCDSHVLLGGALNDGGSAIKWCNDSLKFSQEALASTVERRWSFVSGAAEGAAEGEGEGEKGKERETSTPVVPMGAKLSLASSSLSLPSLLPPGYGFFSSSSEATLTSSAAAAAVVPPSPPPPLLFLPCLGGERSTGWNVDATGQMLGLTTATTGEEIALAAMEGVAFRLKAVLEGIRAIVPSDKVTILASGGALAANALWCQILANALDCRLLLVEDRGGLGLGLEATSKGALLFERFTRSVQPEPYLCGTTAAADDEEGLPTFRPDERVKALWAEAAGRHERFYQQAAAMQHELLKE